MTFHGNGAEQVGVVDHVFRIDEEGSLGVVLAQHLQDAVQVGVAAPVVKGEENHVVLVGDQAKGVQLADLLGGEAGQGQLVVDPVGTHILAGENVHQLLCKLSLVDAPPHLGQNGLLRQGIGIAQLAAHYGRKRPGRVNAALGEEGRHQIAEDGIAGAIEVHAEVEDLAPLQHALALG